MKLLLDECVTHTLRRDLAGHQVHNVEDAGLKGLENSELLKAAAGAYEVLITVDQNIPYQTESRQFTSPFLSSRAWDTCGLKTVRGLGIIAERNAASSAFKFAAG